MPPQHPKSVPSVNRPLACNVGQALPPARAAHAAPSPSGPRHGQIAIMVALSLTFTFTLVGFAVDLGYGYLMKQQAQTAADAAASAAAVYAMNNRDSCGGGGLSCPVTYNCADPATTPATTSLQAGCLYAQQNGFVNDGTRQTVSLTENNTARGGNAPTMWIQATASQSLHNMFLYMPGFHTGRAAASAVAGVTQTPLPTCVYALGTSGTVFNNTAGGNVTLNCGVYANADVNISAGGNLAETAFSYVGAYTKSGGGTVSVAPVKVGTPLPIPFPAFPNPPSPIPAITPTSTSRPTPRSPTAFTATA